MAAKKKKKVKAKKYWMSRKEDRKDKQKPKEPSLSLEQKKLKLREEIRASFVRAFGHEDSAVIPNQRSK
jgi:hypothetical protein